MADFEVTGMDLVITELGQLGPKVIQAAAAALYQEAERVMALSKEQYVPVDLGTLKASGTVSAPEVTASEVTVRLGYGGAAAAYALAVHEHPSAADPPSWRKASSVTFHPAGHGEKYLERPFLDSVTTLEDRLGPALRGALETGGA